MATQRRNVLVALAILFTAQRTLLAQEECPWPSCDGIMVFCLDEPDYYFDESCDDEAPAPTNCMCSEQLNCTVTYEWYVPLYAYVPDTMTGSPVGDPCCCGECYRLIYYGCREVWKCVNSEYGYPCTPIVNECDERFVEVQDTLGYAPFEPCCIAEM